MAVGAASNFHQKADGIFGSAESLSVNSMVIFMVAADLLRVILTR